VTDWVTVNPGDLVVADDDGVVLIPLDMVDKFNRMASDWADKDKSARRDIKNGALLLDTLDKYGHL
jgi:regulator of RNase E activity RraA